MTHSVAFIDAFTNAFSDPVWIAPATLLALGLVAGGVIAWRLTQHSDAGTLLNELNRADLEKRRDEVIAAVRALDLEKDKLSPEEYASQRQALVTHGALALRGLEESMAHPDRDELTATVESKRDVLGDETTNAIVDALQSPTPPPAAPTSTWMSGAVVLGGLSALILLFLTLIVVQERPEPTPAPQVQAGRQASPSAPQLPPPGAREQAWLSSLQSNPNDLAALNGLTDWEIRRQQWNSAIQYNSRALKVSAEDAEANVWGAFLIYRTGNYPKAVEQLEGVIARTPDYARAHQFRGMIHMRFREFDLAITKFNDALARTSDPQEQAGIQALIGEARQGLAANKPELAGSITLAPGVDPKAWGPTAQIFVSVKASSGPPMPLRAKRVPISEFPAKFSIASTDAPMRGGPLPETVSLTVKVDLDGNPMGDDPGAPKVILEGIKPGQLDVAVELGAN